MQKSLSFLILLSLLCAQVAAQSLPAFPNDSAVGTVDVTRSGDQTIYFTNNTAQQIEVAWVITTQTFPQGWFVTLCDDHACHTLPHAGDTTLMMMPGDTNFLHLTAAPLGIPGSMLVRVQLVNLMNTQETNDITFILNAEATAITAPELRDQVSISPSPANDVLYLRTRKGNLDKGSLALYDLQGQLRMLKAVNAAHVATLDVEGLPAGIYLLRYECKSGKVTQKVMVTH